MESAKKGENEKGSASLRIDPECFRDALRTFFQPAKTDDPRLDFYTVYKKEANEYDTDYVKKYDEDLNTTLIFAGLFSAVSSAFVIDIHSKLQPDPNDQSAALLRAILLTLNHSAVPDEAPAVPAVQQNPPNEIVTVTCLLYASLLMSLLAAFVAMLGKQWLNRYLRHAGGSMIERCGDRQRKCDGLQRWPFRLFIESLPVMLQVALLLLACGLCRYMTSVNPAVGYTLITLTSLGVLFYIGVVIAGASSYDCPFQTPGSALLGRLCTKLGPCLTPVALPIINALRTLGWIVWWLVFVIYSSLAAVPPPFHSSCAAVLRPFHSSCVTVYRHLLTLLERIQLGILYINFRLPWIRLNIRRQLPHPPLPMIQTVRDPPNPQEPIDWFAPNELAMIRLKNLDNVRCVSWILRNITDPEAFDAAIRLAGSIRWFEDETDVKPLYDLIVFTFHSCFGSNMLYPGLRNRAYYSGRAILWIHALAKCKSEVIKFPLPAPKYTASASDSDLTHLLVTFQPGHYYYISRLLYVGRGQTPSHSQWISNLLLHLSSVDSSQFTSNHVKLHLSNGDASTPLDTTFNRLLTCCNLLGSPVGEEALKIQDKSDHMLQVLRQVSGAITSALKSSHPNRELIPEVLQILTRLENRPSPAEEACGWCAMIWENRQDYEDWEALLFLSLEVGFRHLRPPGWFSSVDSTLSEYPQELIDTILKSNDSEAVTDLIHASYLVDRSRQLPLRICANYIVDLTRGASEPFSPRLRGIFSRCVESGGFVAMGEEGFVELLNRLHVGINDIAPPFGHNQWVRTLLKITRSPEGARRLIIQHWELLAELATLSWSKSAAHSSDVTASLLEAEEWDKLECWVGFVWMACSQGPGDVVEDLERTTALLFRQRPGAIQKLTRWMERWSKAREVDVPESFQRICKQAHDLALSIPLPNEESPQVLPPTQPSPSG